MILKVYNQTGLKRILKDLYCVPEIFQLCLLSSSVTLIIYIKFCFLVMQYTCFICIRVLHTYIHYLGVFGLDNKNPDKHNKKNRDNNA